jgi:hypothetical protein
MFLVDLDFPKNCRECVFWKCQYCHILKKKISYEDGNKRDPECSLKDYNECLEDRK